MYGSIWLATFSLNVQLTLLQWEDYVDTYIKKKNLVHIIKRFMFGTLLHYYFLNFHYCYLTNIFIISYPLTTTT